MSLMKVIIKDSSGDVFYSYTQCEYEYTGQLQMSAWRTVSSMWLVSFHFNINAVNPLN